MRRVWKWEDGRGSGQEERSGEGDRREGRGRNHGAFLEYGWGGEVWCVVVGCVVCGGGLPKLRLWPLRPGVFLRDFRACSPEKCFEMDMCRDAIWCFIHSSILYCLSISHGQVLTMLLTTGTLPLFNLLFPSINIQILLICPKAFLTVLVGRNCFKTGLSSPFVIIFFILITSILG